MLAKFRSELELLTLLQGRLYALAQDTQAAADVGFEIAVTITESNQFVRHIERRDHGNAIQADDFSAIADLTHFHIEEFGGIKQVGALLDRTGYVILLFEYPAEPHGGMR